jgi:hypothetical protein
MNSNTNIAVVNFNPRKPNQDITDIYEKHINSGPESDYHESSCDSA